MALSRSRSRPTFCQLASAPLIIIERARARTRDFKSLGQELMVSGCKGNSHKQHYANRRRVLVILLLSPWASSISSNNF